MLLADLRARRGAFTLEAAFRIEAGITALFGPNGSGKTTLLHAIAGLVRPCEGSLRLGARTLLDRAQRIDLPAHRRRIGVVFQDLRLFPHCTVEENLAFGRRRARGAGPHLSEVLEVLELAPLARRLPRQLSGGERQRVALGRALLSSPELLLMDEPLAALDARLRRQLLPYLRWVHERYAIPILYVSHALAEILDLTDRVLVLREGRVVGQGEVFEVLGHALDAGGAEPFSTESLLAVEICESHEEGSWLAAKIGAQAVVLPLRSLPVGSLARVGVRPEDVMLARGLLGGISARNQLLGTVRRVSSLHGRLLVHVEIAPGALLRAEVTGQAWQELGCACGSEIVCVIKTSAFRWA